MKTFKSQYSITFYASHSLEDLPPWMVQTIIVADGNELLGNVIKGFPYNFTFPSDGTYRVEDTPIALLHSELVWCHSRPIDYEIEYQDDESGWVDGALLVGRVMP